MVLTQTRRAVKRTYLDRMEQEVSRQPDSDFARIGFDFAKAGMGPALISVMLMCDERTVRAWFRGRTKPRIGDASRLKQLHAKVLIALENNDLPHTGTIEELIDILKKSKKNEVTV